MSKVVWCGSPVLITGELLVVPLSTNLLLLAQSYSELIRDAIQIVAVPCLNRLIGCFFESV